MTYLTTVTVPFCSSFSRRTAQFSSSTSHCTSALQKLLEDVNLTYLFLSPLLSFLLPLSHIPELIVSAFWRKTSISDSLSRMRETALLTQYWMSGSPMHVVISGWLGLLVTFTCERRGEREKEVISLCVCWISFFFVLFCFLFLLFCFCFVLCFDSIFCELPAFLANGTTPW